MAKPKSKLPAISLFSGAGGFDLGMGAHFEIRLMTDFDQSCIDVLRANWQKAYFRDSWHDPENPPEWYQDPEPVILQADITKLPTRTILKLAGLKPGECSVIYGGPPCQGFSRLGKKQDDDPRNGLWKEMLRIVEEARPEVFVLENVPRMAKIQGGRFIAFVKRCFEDAGYNVHWEVINCADYGVPQNRRRLLMTGKRRFPAKMERFFRIRYGRNLAINTGQLALFE